MLYLVSEDLMNRDITHFHDDDFAFVVRANNDTELINAIATVVEEHYCNDDCDTTLDDFDSSVWQVRELGENFDVELSICRKISGKRL